jgi:alpha-beta hydrolase superfamily lysophospholipase
MVTGNNALRPVEVTVNDSGVDIFVRSWHPGTPPRAIFAICHGVNSHGGQYFWVAEQMVARGFAVYALDLRGRGRSGGKRFHVESVEDYVSDLAAMIDLAKKREGALPVYLLGHSAGGVVSCIYALEFQSKLAGFICESFAFQVPTPDFALALVKGLSYVAPDANVLRLKNEHFSRDPAVVARLNDDPLIAGEIQPAQTVAALVRADERLKREFPSITLPLFILHGTADQATNPSGSQFFEQAAGSRDKSLKLYEGHYHDLLSDIGKERVIADIQQWIEERLDVVRE